MPDWLVVLCGALAVLVVAVLGEAPRMWHALRDLFRALVEFAAWPIRQLTTRRPATAGEDDAAYCTQTLGYAAWAGSWVCDGGDPVPVHSVVTGELLTERCPTCWLPRRAKPVPPSGSGGVATARLPADHGPGGTYFACCSWCPWGERHTSMDAAEQAVHHHNATGHQQAPRIGTEPGWK